MKTPRAHLNDYTYAMREIELAEVAVKILEALNSIESRRAIKMLLKLQQRQVKRLDAAAAKLGAPYGSKT